MRARCRACGATITEEQHRACPRSYGVAQAVLGAVMPGLGLASLGSLGGAGILFAGTLAALVLGTQLALALHVVGVFYTFLLARDHGRCPHCGEWTRLPPLGRGPAAAAAPEGGVDAARAQAAQRVAVLSVASLGGTWALAALPVALYLLGGRLMGPRRGDGEALLIALSGGTPVALLGLYLLWTTASPDEQARREVFAEFAGWAVDVGRLRGARGPLRARLLQRLDEELRGLPSPGYREGYEAERDWARLAVDPLVTQPSVLRAALTLARVEASLAPRPERRRLRQVEAAIWRRLQRQAQPAP